MKELISKPEVFNYGKLGKIRGLVVNKNRGLLLEMYATH